MRGARHDRSEHEAERRPRRARSASPRTPGRARSRRSSRSSSTTSATSSSTTGRRVRRRSAGRTDQRVAHALPGRPEDLHDARPRLAGLRAGGRRREPVHRPATNSPDISLVSVDADDRRDQGDALGQGLPPRPARPRLARDAARSARRSSRSRSSPRSARGSRRARSTRRSRRCATSMGWISASGCVSNAEGGRRRRLHGPVDGDAELRERGVRAARARRRTREHRRGRPPDGHHVRARRGPVDHARRRGGLHARHGVRVRRRSRTTAMHCKPFAVARVERARGTPASPDASYKHHSAVQAGDRPRHRAPRHGHARSAWCRGGTGTAAGNIGRPVAGKTGTAQDYTNVYFAGYTPQVATAVWVGFPYGQIPMDTLLRGLRVRRDGGRADLARLHDQGDAGLSRSRASRRRRRPRAARSPTSSGMQTEEAQQTLAEANFTPIVREGRLVRAGQHRPLAVARAAGPAPSSGAP